MMDKVVAKSQICPHNPDMSSPSSTATRALIYEPWEATPGWSDARLTAQGSHLSIILSDPEAISYQICSPVQQIPFFHVYF